MYSPIFVWIGFILLGSITISQCSATEEETKGCLNDKYIVSVFNVNDKSTVTVNGRLVTTQKFLENSGPIDVSKDMIVGKNTFTFKTFNGPDHYAWGFQLKKNGATVFYTKEGEAEGGGKGARNNDLTRLNQIVYDKTITIDISDCSPKPLTPIKGCLEDKYTVTVFNADDTSTVNVNGRIIITKNFLDNPETIDVSKNMISGTNKLIFKTYNGGTRYAWGFELKKNGERVFYAKEGDAAGHDGGANNNDVTRENQVVYDKTVIIETTECSPKPPAPIKGCLEDKYTVTVFNTDDKSTVDVNGRIVITKNLLDNPETIDVSKNMISGTNKLIFKTYNGGGGYSWGFELKKNGERVFYSKNEVEYVGPESGANNNGSPGAMQVVFDKTVIIETTECSPKPSTPIKGCLDDKYTVTVFNTDDKSTVDVNGRLVITKHYLENSETIDVSKDMVSGTNKLTFKTYNGQNRYAWGFDLKRNGITVFYTKEGDAEGEGNGARDNDLARLNQVVYDKTVIIDTSECCPKISTNKPTMLTSFKCGAQNYCIRKCFPESNTNDMGRPTGVSTCYAYNTKSGYTCERDSDCTSTAKCIAPCRANTILL